MPNINDCLGHGWENPINKELERRFLNRRSELEEESEEEDEQDGTG